jgi:hypothetical protein
VRQLLQINKERVRRELGTSSTKETTEKRGISKVREEGEGGWSHKELSK